MRICVVKHVPFEGPALIARWAVLRGHALKVIELEQGQALPGLGDFDLLVLMGGPMSVNDGARFAWLAPEMELVRAALAAEKRVLGICLGAQVMAAALGAKVLAMGHREIGWFPVRGLFPEHPWVEGMDGATIFHWHGEAFEDPPGVRRLLFSEACSNQAFAVGRLGLGLQCHFEADAEAIEQMISHGMHEIHAGGQWVQSSDAIKGGCAHEYAQAARCFKLLDRFVGA